ncbi:SMP-30/gluconolactonase/LRE family protein [Rhodobacter capsulatus]|uniref:SMP-30/gluconolactonase/LRE family protein n=1 Tax=Rhodobacter capsulatus TaxID=1061 RepID=UPI00402619A7
MSGAEVFDPRPCALGEGALWHPLRQELFWFDILAGRLMTQDRHWDFGEPASAAGWIDAESLLVATASALVQLDLASGRTTPVTPLEADQPQTRSNDGRADPMGGFWIGTMGRKAEPGAGALYRFHAGRLVKLRENMTIPNAICFAPGGRRVYFADTAEARIWTQPLDTEGWPEAEAQVFVDLAPEGLNPDGAVVDAQGALWNAQWGAGRVARYLPDGRFDRALALPVPQTTCPAFGGPGFDRLFVTSAREGLDATALAAAPLSGQVFTLDPGTTGCPEPAVRL